MRHRWRLTLCYLSCILSTLPELAVSATIAPVSSRQKYIDAYHAAMQHERDLWAQLHDKQPGSPRFDPKLWTDWLESVSASNAASKAMREAYASDPEDSDDGREDSAVPQGNRRS